MVLVLLFSDTEILYFLSTAKCQMVFLITSQNCIGLHRFFVILSFSHSHILTFSHSTVSTEENVQYALFTLHIHLLRYVYDLQFDAKKIEEMIAYTKRSTLNNARAQNEINVFVCSINTTKKTNRMKKKKPYQNEILIFSRRETKNTNFFLRSTIRLVECIQW